MSELKIDLTRIDRYETFTGILVRARGPQGVDNFDIAQLSRDSLLQWLKEHDGPDGSQQFAAKVILVLFGHTPIEKIGEDI